MIDIPAAIDAVAERLNATAIPVLRDRIAAMGEKASGAYNFYAQRAEAGNLFWSHERKLVAALLEHFGKRRPVIHEFGSGFGTVSWMLAGLGFETVCIEHDAARIAGGEAIWDAIVRGTAPEGSCTYSKIDIVTDPPVTDGICLIATNVIYTTTPERRADILKALARYPEVIFDVDRMIWQSETEADRRALVGTMEDHGMTAAVFFDQGGGGRFWRFERTAPAAPAFFDRTPHGAAFAEILERRGVDRVVHVHADHWEPWQDARGLDREGQMARDTGQIIDYFERVSRLDHGRKLTLFYRPEIGTTDDPRVAARRVPGDQLGMKDRRPGADERITAAFAEARARGPGLELQLHVHHEFLTYNARYSQQEYPALFQQFDPVLDPARWELAMDISMERFERDTGVRLDRWFFVHGMWALNASDADVCSITDEMARLRRRGCLGDFSFPAGRKHCDPTTYDVPMFVRTVTGPKSYDTAAADACPPGPGALGDDRFFIWASRNRTEDVSLDFVVSDVARNVANVGAWGDRLLKGSFVAGRTLYLKTHAHSMNAFYWGPESGRAGGLLPHEHTGVRRLFGAIEEACGRIGGRLDHLTASEGYAEFEAMAARPPQIYGGYIDDPRVPDAVFEAADRIGLTALRERLETMASDPGGLHAAYVERLDQGALLRPAQKKAADLVVALTPPGMPVVHLKPGCGEVSLALALAGRPVLSVEAGQARDGAQRAVFDAAIAERPDLAGRLEAMRCPYGSIPPDRLTGACILATDAVATTTDDEFERILALLSRADMVILDLLRLFRRTTVADHGAVIDRLKAAGLPEPRPVLDLNDDGLYVLIDNRPNRPVVPAQADGRKPLVSRLMAMLGARP